MKAGIPNYRITPSMDDGSVIIRKARMQHVCSGSHNGEKNIHCTNGPIKQGSAYVEYVGESSPYESGRRYHPDCAVTQGLLERI